MQLLGSCKTNKKRIPLNRTGSVKIAGMIIHRYITKEVLTNLAIAVVGLNLFLMMEKVLRLSRILSGVGASMGEMLWLILLIQPQLLMVTIPMAFLMSLLLTFGRLSMDNELIVLRTTGASFQGISSPVITLSIFLTILTLIVSLIVMPAAMKKLRNEVNGLISKRLSSSIEPGVFFNMLDHMVLFVGSSSPTGELGDIFIYDGRKEKRGVITAKKGKVGASGKNIHIALQDGTFSMTNGGNGTVIEFGRYDIDLNPEGELLGERKVEMRPDELLRRADKNPSERADYFIEFHRRFSYPLLVLVIAFLGPGLSLLSGRTGRLGGFVTGIGIFVFYYILMVYTENMVKTGGLHHLFCWTPFLLLSILSFIVFRKTQ